MTNLFNVSFDGFTAFQDKLKAASISASNLTYPLERAAALTAETAMLRIKIGGDPEWLPSQRVIEKGGVTGILTGAMMGSIKPGSVVISGAVGSVKVGLSGPSAKYGTIFQRGSGSRGGNSDWTVTIRAKNAQALSWVSGGKRYFARSVTQLHRGQVPRPFLYFDDPLKLKIINLFKKYLGGES